MHIAFLSVFSCLVLVASGQQAPAVQCPSQCVCFSSTVRCMFLGMTEVPTDDIDSLTTVL
jgi:hypothetical protein